MSMADEFEDNSLEADLAAALDVDKPTVEASEVETVETQEARDYARDEAGRFAQKQKEEAEAAAAVDPTTPKPAEVAKVWKPTWYKDEYGPWDKIGEPLRNALREQERNAAQAIQTHSTAAKAWEPLNKALEPYADVMRQHNMTPQTYFMNLMEYDKALRDPDPVKRIDKLDELARSVGLDLVQVGQWLQDNGPAPQPDPRDQRIKQLEQRVTQFETQGQRSQREAIDSEIAAWSKDKTDFPAVRKLMGALAKENPESSLDELYEQARWTHPETRTRILKEQEDKRLAELKDKRRMGAQSPRSGSNGSARSQRPTMSLEDEIAMHLDGGV